MLFAHPFPQRIKDWFFNQIRAPKGESDGSRKNSFLNLTGSKNTRRENAYQAYFRIFRDRLDIEVQEAFKKHKAENGEKVGDDIPDDSTPSSTPSSNPSSTPSSTQTSTEKKEPCFIAFRNSWLAKKLQEESDEVRDFVEKSRRDAGESAGARKDGNVASVLSARTEKERLERARAMQG